MSKLNDNLSNILHTLQILEEILITKLESKEFSNNSLDENLRSLNFEANEFFEKLTPDFDIANENLNNIINKISNILKLCNFEDYSLFEFKINILNLQIFLPIHLLFSLSSNTLIYQLENQHFLVDLVDQLFTFEDLPKFPKVLTLEEKHILDNHLRILGSSGDLYYLLCSNLSLIKEKNIISWANKCFKKFYLLDLSLDKFDPLEFYYSNNLPLEDFYREIVGHYTILGNTNATNLLEYLLSVDNENILNKVTFIPYIESPKIQSLEKKLEFKAKKIRDLLDRVVDSKNNNRYFSLSDDPLNIISFKLMIALEKYFNFTISKIKTYQKEFDQLQTPASTELKNTLALCEDWLDTTLSLTESNENILDTPFGGLFNSVFLEYLLLLALDDGKIGSENKSKTPLLEQKLEKYKEIFLTENHSLESISDFIYFKTYAQIYVYTSLGKIDTLKDLIEELYSLLQYLDKRPFLKLNSLILLQVLEIIVNKKPLDQVSNVREQLISMLDPVHGLFHLKEEVLSYIDNIKPFFDINQNKNLHSRSKSKILDINSWLIPNFSHRSFDQEYQGFYFLSFNQLKDRIIP